MKFAGYPVWNFSKWQKSEIKIKAEFSSNYKLCFSSWYRAHADAHSELYILPDITYLKSRISGPSLIAKLGCSPGVKKGRFQIRHRSCKKVWFRIRGLNNHIQLRFSTRFFYLNIYWTKLSNDISIIFTLISTEKSLNFMGSVPDPVYFHRGTNLDAVCL